MTAPSLNAIEAAIQSLQARQPKPRDFKQELAPYVEQLLHLIAGWTCAEIIAEVKALGDKIPPAFLRDVLQASPAKPKKIAPPKQAKPSPSEAPNTGTVQRDQPVADAE